MRSSTSPHAVAVARLAELPLPGVRRGAVDAAPRRLPCGIEPIDALLNGGWPQSRISEVYGPASCGKSSLVMALLATTSRRGELIAYIDAAHALHPTSMAERGADMQRILWIRPPCLRDALRCAELVLRGGGFALTVLDVGVAAARGLRGHTWPRLLHAAEKSHTALLVLAPQRVAGSFATLSLSVRPRRIVWRRGLWPLFEGFESVATVERNKLGPPGRAVRLETSSAPVAGRLSSVG